MFSELECSKSVYYRVVVVELIAEMTKKDFLLPRASDWKEIRVPLIARYLQRVKAKRRK